MNKRKPDDEFALINLSYINSSGTEVVVYCPESKDAAATQHPTRRKLSASEETAVQPEEVVAVEDISPEALQSPALSAPQEAADVLPEVREKHFTILYGDTGHSYETIIGPYLSGAKSVVIEDPYIRLPHQIQNFVRFCETVLKSGTVKKIDLVTGYDDNTQLAEIHEKLEDLKQSLLEVDVILEVKLNPNIHDREIRLDNGWVIKIGRGLDFYQRPTSWFEVGANDLSLRKCLETKVDIYQLEIKN